MNLTQPTEARAVLASDMLDPQAMSEQYGNSVQYWAKLRLYGGGPAFFKIGRSVRYRRADVETWLSARRFENTAQAEAARAA